MKQLFPPALKGASSSIRRLAQGIKHSPNEFIPLDYVLTALDAKLGLGFLNSQGNSIPLKTIVTSEEPKAQAIREVAETIMSDPDVTFGLMQLEKNKKQLEQLAQIRQGKSF